MVQNTTYAKKRETIELLHGARCLFVANTLGKAQVRLVDEWSPQRGPPADTHVDITSSGTKTHVEERNKRCEWRPECPHF